MKFKLIGPKLVAKMGMDIKTLNLARLEPSSSTSKSKMLMVPASPFCCKNLHLDFRTSSIAIPNERELLIRSFMNVYMKGGDGDISYNFVNTIDDPTKATFTRIFKVNTMISHAEGNTWYYTPNPMLDDMNAPTAAGMGNFKNGDDTVMGATSDIFSGTDKAYTQAQYPNDGGADIKDKGRAMEVDPVNPITPGEPAKFWCFMYLDLEHYHRFERQGENAYLSYWCKEHKTRVKVGVLEVRWTSRRSFATYGCPNLDKVMGIPLRPKFEPLGYRKNFHGWRTWLWESTFMFFAAGDDW